MRRGYHCLPRTIVKYTIEMNRATFYYGTLIIFPTILITYLSFGVFFMSHEVGESGQHLQGPALTILLGWSMRGRPRAVSASVPRLRLVKTPMFN